jgi:ABC-type antimicrobial peptide transport system permease subunit
MILALGMVAVALPYFNELAGKSIGLPLLDAAFLGKMIGVTAATGLLAGCYPALYLSAFNAVQVLKGTRIVKGSFLRNGLVVLQFTIAVVMMISTMIVYRQLNYIRNRDIGFDKNNLLYLFIPELGERDRNEDALRSALSQSPLITSMSFSNDLPTNLHTASPLSWRGMPHGSLTMTSRLAVDEHFIDTYGMTMAAGRFFNNVYKAKDSEYVINETAARFMGLEPATAVGKMITLNGNEGTIIGVVKDFNFRDVHESIRPLVLKHIHNSMYLVVRAPMQATGSVLATIQNCFQRLYGNVPFTYGFIDQDLEHLYSTEQRMGSLFTVFSILSILISCLGLFGLASFTTRRRTKEIGVRKVLGAGEAGIVALLAKEFLRLVALSLVIAFPVAWWAMHRWLEGFAYKIPIGGWVFAAAGGVALLIAFVTVSFQTIRAAMANPVQSLRTE